MTLTALIGAFLNFIVLCVMQWFERDKRRKELKAEALKELFDGIKERDPSKISVAIDRANRIRR